MKKILTGASALYEQKLISYKPAKDHFEMLFGTNTKSYKTIKISLQKKETFDIGAIKVNGKWCYGSERLFIELNKFSLENTIKDEAIKKLKNIIEPEKVNKYYSVLKKKRRGLDNKMIEDYLNLNLLLIKDALSKAKDKNTIIREYIMALVSSKGIPISLIKGGSSIELFTKINRATLDIDAHAGKDSILSILKYLFSKDRPIYFKLNEKDDSMKVFENLKESRNSKNVIKISLVPISRGGSNKEELENISIPMSFNCSYSEKELQQIIIDYQLTKRQLKYLKNSKAMVFSKEMLLAEKFQLLVAKPSSSTRTKDLIDLKLLWQDEINFKLFRKWLFRKWSTGRFPKTKEEAILIIKENSSKPLTKIKNNFKDAVNMYDVDINFNECISIYKILIKEATK